MNITLKNCKVFLAMSEETTAFVADVCVDGIKCAYAKNDGHGGSTYYTSYHKPNDDEILRQAEKFALSLPAQKIDMGEGRTFTHKMDLEAVIDNLVEDELKAKENKKQIQKMETCLMWGTPKALSYTQVKFKIPLAQIPTAKLQELVDKYKKEFKDGQQFLNTNLEKLGIKL